MVYLESFKLLSRDAEEAFLWDLGSTCEESRYPFNVFRYRSIPTFEFEPITIFYGSNGSGKSTILNVIAEKIHVHHRTPFNKTEYFSDYVQRCRAELSPMFSEKHLRKSKIITSDDVFDYLIDVRYLNEGIDNDRNAVFEEYGAIRNHLYSCPGDNFKMQSLDDYETLKKYSQIARIAKKRGSAVSYVKPRTMRNVREQSNGESALRFFTEQIEDHGLYLLDEPENSLSAENQLRLRQFIEESARFYGCQFIISSHSPFMLSTKGVKIYNLDETPPCPRKWTELPNVRAYYHLFAEHKEEFENSYT